MTRNRDASVAEPLGNSPKNFMLCKNCRTGIDREGENLVHDLTRERECASADVLDRLRAEVQAGAALSSMASGDAASSHEHEPPAC